jgi:hypothetical protein
VCSRGYKSTYICKTAARNTHNIKLDRVFGCICKRSGVGDFSVQEWVSCRSTVRLYTACKHTQCAIKKYLTYRQSAIWKPCRQVWGLPSLDADRCAVWTVAANQARTITSRQAINYRVEENLLAIYSVNLTKNGLAQCPRTQNIMTAGSVWLTCMLLYLPRLVLCSQWSQLNLMTCGFILVDTLYVLQTWRPFNRWSDAGVPILRT